MNGFYIKLLAMLLMLGDHIGYFFPTNQTIYLRFIGRLVAPVFMFFVVEGFFKTRDRNKYAFRLFKWGLFMGVGNTLIQYIFNVKNVSFLQPNMLITLSLCITLLIYVDKIKSGINRKNCFNFIKCILVCIAIFFTEGGILAVFMVLTFYFLYNKKIYMAITYIIGSLTLPFIFSGNIQFLMVFAIIPILLYNGERGFNNKFAKYLFYMFYPIHVWILAILSIV